MATKVQLLEYIIRERTRLMKELVTELELYQAKIPSTKCCKAWIRGLPCWAEKECRFKHPRKGECYKWIETGTCRFGSKCKYSHPVEEEPYEPEEVEEADAEEADADEDEEPYDEEEDEYAESMREQRRNMHDKLEYEES
jgi:hypothetical protein